MSQNTNRQETPAYLLLASYHEPTAYHQEEMFAVQLCQLTVKLMCSKSPKLVGIQLFFPKTFISPWILTHACKSA